MPARPGPGQASGHLLCLAQQAGGCDRGRESGPGTACMTRLRGCSPRGEGEPLSTAAPLVVSTHLPPPWTGKGGCREPALGSQTQQSVAERQMVASDGV